MSSAESAYQSRIFLSNNSYIKNGIFESNSYQRDFVFNNGSYMDTFQLGGDSNQQNFNFNNLSYQSSCTLIGVNQEFIYMDKGSQSNGFSETQTNITVKGYDIDWSTYPPISPQTDLYFIHNLVNDDTAPVYIGKINNRLVEVTKPIDIFVTGATKSGSVATFTNNTGGTFSLTGLTDTFLTGGTYDVNSETIILNNNNGSNISITGITLPSLLVTDGSVTVTPVTGITFSGATVVDDGGGDITVVTGTIRRNDTVGNINYCGFALTGSLESDPVWTITVITVALDGSVTSVVYYNVAWTDRYIL
jgi:hypothetical protein